MLMISTNVKGWFFLIRLMYLNFFKRESNFNNLNLQFFMIIVCYRKIALNILIFDIFTFYVIKGDLKMYCLDNLKFRKNLYYLISHVCVVL